MERFGAQYVVIVNNKESREAAMRDAELPRRSRMRVAYARDLLDTLGRLVSHRDGGSPIPGPALTRVDRVPLDAARSAELVRAFAHRHQSSKPAWRSAVNPIPLSVISSRNPKRRRSFSPAVNRRSHEHCKSSVSRAARTATAACRATSYNSRSSAIPKGSSGDRRCNIMRASCNGRSGSGRPARDTKAQDRARLDDDLGRCSSSQIAVGLDRQWPIA
jgi:hypothetical protein